MTKTNVKSTTRSIKSGMTVKSKKFDVSDDIKEIKFDRTKQSKKLIRVFNNPSFLKNKLPVQVSLIVPSTKIDKSISTEEFDKRVVAETKWFNKMFGGSTRFDVVGSYNNDGKLIIENGVRIESSMSLKDFESKTTAIDKHVKTLIKKWNQDSVIIRIEGQDFVTPKKKYIGNDKDQSELIIVT